MKDAQGRTLYVKTPPLRFRDRPTLRLDERGQMKAAEHMTAGDFGKTEFPRHFDEFDRFWRERWH